MPRNVFVSGLRQASKVRWSFLRTTTILGPRANREGPKDKDDKTMDEPIETSEESLVSLSTLVPGSSPLDLMSRRPIWTVYLRCPLRQGSTTRHSSFFYVESFELAITFLAGGIERVWTLRPGPPTKVVSP